MFFFDNFLFMVFLCLSSVTASWWPGSLLVLGFAPGADLVFDLQIGQPLMVEHLAEVPPVEVQMGVAEVDKSDDGDEDDQIGVLGLTFRLERIFTRLVPIR